jgi:transposase
VSGLGISRTLFYRWRKRLERYGVDGVHPRRQRGRAGRPVATPPEVERLLGIAISAAAWGCRRIAAYLARTWQVRVAPSTVQRLLRRVGLATRRARLTVLEQQAARTAGLLTDRTRRTLWRARHGHDAAAAATFLRAVVVPHFQRAGWPVRRVLTDGGPEFKGAFDVACRDLALRHTRTKPRHAWTNGFVERLQGTILQELWRVVFRRRYFTSRAGLQRALDGFMHHYNTERPHHGYRVRGRTPTALVWGVAAVQ